MTRNFSLRQIVAGFTLCHPEIFPHRRNPLRVRALCISAVICRTMSKNAYTIMQQSEGNSHIIRWKTPGNDAPKDKITSSARLRSQPPLSNQRAFPNRPGSQRAAPLSIYRFIMVPSETKKTQR